MFGGFESGPDGGDENPKKWPEISPKETDDDSRPINRIEALEAVFTEKFEGYPQGSSGTAQTDSDGKGGAAKTDSDGKGGAVQTDSDDDDDDEPKKI